jgi:flagellar hook-basal body complex protein FliE
VESINNSLDSSSILLSGMKSNAAVKKAADAGTETASAGSVLNNFGDLLKTELGNINNLQSQADQAAQTYAVGGNIELHNVILAAEKADMALQLALQIRNRMISAYQEISRMNI